MLTAFCFLFEWDNNLLFRLSPLAIGEKVNILRRQRHSLNISNKGKLALQPALCKQATKTEKQTNTGSPWEDFYHLADPDGFSIVTYIISLNLLFLLCAFVTHFLLNLWIFCRLSPGLRERSMCFFRPGRVEWEVNGFQGVTVDQSIATLTVELPWWSIHHLTISTPSLKPEKMLC